MTISIIIIDLERWKKSWAPAPLKIFYTHGFYISNFIRMFIICLSCYWAKIPLTSLDLYPDFISTFSFFSFFPLFPLEKLAKLEAVGWASSLILQRKTPPLLPQNRKQAPPLARRGKKRKKKEKKRERKGKKVEYHCRFRFRKPQYLNNLN